MGCLKSQLSLFPEGGKSSVKKMIHPEDPWNLLRRGRTLYNKGLYPQNISKTLVFEEFFEGADPKGTRSSRRTRLFPQISTTDHGPKKKPPGRPPCVASEARLQEIARSEPCQSLRRHLGTCGGRGRGSRGEDQAFRCEEAWFVSHGRVW